MRVSAVAAVCLCFCACAAAQSVASPQLPADPAQAAASHPDTNSPGGRWQRLTAEAGGGFTSPNGNASDLIHVGWNARLGAGWNFSHSIGLLGEYEFNRFGWQSPVLTGGGRANGNVHLWGLTLEPVWRYKFTKHLGGYAVVGGGFFRQTTTFANTVPGIDCNPFFGCYLPVPGAPVLHSSGNQVGAIGGVGFTYKPNPAHHWAYYTEVRFEWLDTRPETAAFFPVNFGLRW